MPKRCALGCSNKNSYHQFPHPEKKPDRFKAWVHIAGGKLNSQADYELYRKKVICDIHFTDRDRNRNNRLNFLAVPSHLPDNHQQKEVPSFLLKQLQTTRKIKILQSNFIRSQKKNKTLKSRIAIAEKLSTDLLLKKLTNKMTNAAKIFTKMQYTEKSKKPSGCRFSLEEKVLSLSLHKKSPRSYPLLAKFFFIPFNKPDFVWQNHISW